MKYSEFSFIESIKSLVNVPQGCEGIGDDCAVIDIGSKAQVITTDMLVEGVHFLRDKISAFDLGRKSVAVNLSDVAAMGASADAIFLSLSLPQGVDNEWLDNFMKGVTSWGVPLLGGDTTGSMGDIVINIVALGSAPHDCIKRRSGARIGDAIYVTGNLGDSAAGLQAILKSINDKELIYAHNNPQPHINQGITLGKCTSVHSMMDVSDGVASDLKHILKSSSTSAIIDTTQIPTSKHLKEFCIKYNFNTLELSLGGGEDYVLLFTGDDNIKMPFPIYRIGKIVEGKDCSIIYTPHNIDLKGFTHF